MSGEELFREELFGVNGDDRKSPKRNSAEGNCPKRNGLGVNYYEELSGEELSYNPPCHTQVIYPLILCKKGALAKIGH